MPLAPPVDVAEAVLVSQQVAAHAAARQKVAELGAADASCAVWVGRAADLAAWVVCALQPPCSKPYVCDITRARLLQHPLQRAAAPGVMAPPPCFKYITITRATRASLSLQVKALVRTSLQALIAHRRSICTRPGQRLGPQGTAAALGPSRKVVCSGGARNDRFGRSVVRKRRRQGASLRQPVTWPGDCWCSSGRGARTWGEASCIERTHFRLSIPAQDPDSYVGGGASGVAASPQQSAE
jgi:hypothetical protein